MKKNLKLDNNQYGEKRKHVTESEFVESVLHVEPRWLPHQARAIFQQGQQQLAEQHAQEGRSTNNTTVVAVVAAAAAVVQPQWLKVPCRRGRAFPADPAVLGSLQPPTR